MQNAIYISMQLTTWFYFFLLASFHSTYKQVKDFLIEELKRRDGNPAKANMLFEEAEIEAVFRMADLMQVGTVSVSF